MCPAGALRVASSRIREPHTFIPEEVRTVEFYGDPITGTLVRVDDEPWFLCRSDQSVMTWALIGRNDHIAGRPPGHALPAAGSAPWVAVWAETALAIGRSVRLFTHRARHVPHSLARAAVCKGLTRLHQPAVPPHMLRPLRCAGSALMFDWGAAIIRS